MKRQHMRRQLTMSFITLALLLWSGLAYAQSVRVGIYQYQGSSASQQLPFPDTIRSAYDNAYGAANVTINFVRQDATWVREADLQNIDVLWISRYISQAATPQEIELLSNFVKSGKHVVFSSIETHTTQLNAILTEIVGRSVNVTQTSSGVNPFPDVTGLFGLGTGLTNLRNTGSYDRYTSIPACNRVASDSLFLIPGRRVRQGTFFASGEIQSFSSIGSYNTADWQTLAGRIAGLHKTYMYETQAQLEAKDTTDFFNSPCANDLIVQPNVGINTPATGSVTSDTTPTIAGSVTPGDPVVVTISNAQGVVQTVTPIVDANGEWTFDANALPEGDYTINASSTNANGDTATAVPVTFTVDITAPVITTTAPVNGSSTNDTTPALTGTGEPGTDVTLVLTDGAGNPIQTLTVTPDASGNWSVDAAVLAEGPYTLTANSVDAAGNAATPVTTSFEVDVTAPTVALVTPADGSSLNDNTPTLSGTAEPGVSLTVVLTDANGVVQTLNPTVNAQGNWSIDAAVLPDGDYTVVATATDDAGNTATDGPNGFSIDTVEPAVDIVSPIDGTVTNNNSPALTGTVEATAGTTLMVTLTDAQGNIVMVAPAVLVMGTWSIATAMLPDGTYTITAVATDAAGNSSTDLSSFTIDTLPPVLTLDTPADGTVTTDSTPTFSGTGEPGQTVNVTVAGTSSEQLTATVDAQGNWSVDSAGLADGPYTVTSTSTDDAGNTATDGPNGFSVDSTPPTIALGSPADGSFTNDTTPLLAGTSEPGSAVVVEIRDANGALVQTVVMTPNAAGDFNAETPVVLPDGTYTAVAIATDAAGNTAADTHTFTVDTIEPVVTIVEPADLSSTNNTTPTISGTSDSPTDVIVTVTNDDGTVIFTETVPVDAQGNWTLVTPTPLDEDTYIVEASSLDQAGNGGSTTSTFDIDLTAPALEITAPADDEVLSVRDVDVVGVTDPSTEVIVELKDDQGMIVDTQTVVSDVNGDWTVTFQGVANGEYDADASSTDAAGNTATDTQGFSVDSDEPNLTVINPEDNATLNDSTPGIDGTTDPDATVTVVITDDQGTEVETLTVTPNPDGTWSTEPTTDLADGDYTVSTTATRPNGKSTTVDRDITIDTSVPTVVISSPVDGSTTNETAVVVTGTTEPGATVEVTITDDADMVVFTGTATADDQGAFSVDAGMLTDGEFTVAAVATDAAGNAGDAQNDFTINTSAPTLTIASPVAGDTVEDTTPTVTGTADPGATVEVFVDGESIGTVVADDQGQWSLDVTEPLGEGDHTVEAKTTNDAGTEFATGEVPFTVETPGDDVVITSPTDGSEVTGPSVVVTGTGTPGSQVEVTIGDQTQTVTVDENGDWTATLDPVPAGDATITATSEGKTSTVDVTVINPTPDLLLAGGACGGSVTGSNTPVSNLILMLLSFGLVFGLRRRRR